MPADILGLGNLSPRDLPGLDPTFAPAGLPSKPSVFPVAAGLPTAGNLPITVNGGPSGLDKLSAILRLAIPALAAGYALKSGGGLDAFANSYAHGEDVAARRRAEEDERRYREESVRRQIADAARRQAHEERLEAQNIERLHAEQQARAAAAKVAQDKNIHDLLRQSLTPILTQEFLDKVNRVGAENYAISVPGLGPINVGEAITKYGLAAKGPDGYVSPLPQKPAASEPLEEIVGSNGQPVLAPRSKAVGQRRYHKPDKPEKPTKRRTVIRRMADPDGLPGDVAEFLVDADTGEVIKKITAPSPAVSHGSSVSGDKKSDPLGIR